MSQSVTSLGTCRPNSGTEGEFETPDSELPPFEFQQSAHERLLPMARRLDPADVLSMRSDLRLACANARHGHAAFAPYLDKARAIRGVEVDFDLVENVGSLAGALLFAQWRLDRAEPNPKTLAPRLAQGRKLRHAMLRQAQAAAAVGLIPEGPVETIEKGNGPIDIAEDLVALVDLFKEHQRVLHHRSVVDGALLQEAERLGNELQNELKPRGLPDRKPLTSDEKQKARDDRDRFWTLLVKAHKELKRVADFLGVGDLIPSLQSRKPLKKKPAAANPEPPAATE